MSLSINDGKGTPVAHVFTQDSQQNGTSPAEFVNRSNVNGPNFWERLKAWCTLGTRASQPHVLKFNMVRPIAGTIDGNPAVLGQHKAILTLLIDQSVADASDVKDTIAMIANFGQNATVQTAVSSFAPLVIP